MKPNTKRSRQMLAIAAATLLSSTAGIEIAAASEKVECAGVNRCRGQSACQTANSACKGKNDCKGQGFLMLTPERCEEKGGTIQS